MERGELSAPPRAWVRRGRARPPSPQNTAFKFHHLPRYPPHGPHTNPSGGWQESITKMSLAVGCVSHCISNLAHGCATEPESFPDRYLLIRINRYVYIGCQIV